jgi:S1-C subfamily serine protease
MRPNVRRAHRLLAAGLLLVAGAAWAQDATVPAIAPATTPGRPDAASISAARDRVLPVVVSILAVRQDYRQGEPVLSVSSGSGTVVSPQGHIATNAHVTRNGRSFRVVFGDGRELPARLVGTDTLSDLAVLKIEPPRPETFRYAEFATTLDLHAGDTVLAMGAPWGLSNSMSAGVVNNPQRLLVSLFDDEAEYEDSLGEDEPTGRYYAWIQHDAAIAPGNSGGPLVDLRGRIVGVNTRGMISGGDLAFAIPGPEAGRVVKALIEHGRVERVSLGFRLRSLKGTAHDHGVLVNSVERGSPPEKAGLRAGDRVLAINGEPVDALQPVDVPAVQRRIAELPVDSKVRLQVVRAGTPREIVLTAEMQERERGEEAAFVPLGVSVSELTAAMGRRRNLDSRSGLLVTGIRPGGPAAIARPELRAGDVLRKVGGRAVNNLADLQAAVPPTKAKMPLVVEYENNGEQRLAVLTPVFGDQAHNPLPELAKAWVGVDVQPVTASLAKDLGLASPGFRITRIYPGSPLASAGARVGDLLTAIDGEPLKPANDTSAEGFEQRVRDLEPEARARFAALRDSQAREFDVALADSPIETSGLRTLAVTRLRAQLRELGFYDRVSAKLPRDAVGVIVDGVESGGAAGLAHLRRGDVIVSLGARPVETPAQLSKALDAELAESGDELIPLQVIRGGDVRILYLERYWLTADTMEKS